MFSQVHRRLREEEGISLVEVLVSIVLMGLVLAALGSTLFGSMASARQNEGLTKATALANERIEKLRNMPWGNLLQSSFPAPESVSRERRLYTVTTTVTPDPAAPGNFKRYTVDLQWQENNRTQTLRLAGQRARRATERNDPPPPPPNSFRVVVFNVNPDPVLLDTTGKTLPGTFDPPLPGNPAMLIEVELSEAAAANSVVVKWPIPSPTQTLTLTEVAGSAGRKWSGTVPSGQTYPAGWMTFQVTATKSGTSTTITGTTAAYLQAPIQDGPLHFDNNKMREYSFTGTPGPTGNRLCYKDTTLRLRNSNPFYLGLKGLGADDVVTLVRTDQAGVSFPMTWTKVATNWWWYADVSATGAGTFSPNANSTWEIRWTRSYDGLSSMIPLTFYSQLANGNSAC